MPHEREDAAGEPHRPDPRRRHASRTCRSRRPRSSPSASPAISRPCSRSASTAGREPESPSRSRRRAGEIPAPYTETLGREPDVARRARSARRRLRAAGHPRRPGRDRQEPARDRGGAARRGRPSTGRDVRPARARHRPRAACIPAIAAELGVRDSGRGSIAERHRRARGDRRTLIVLDNFEQVLDAAPPLVELSDRAARARPSS